MVLFKDNAAGKWADCRFGQGAYGVAAAMLRLEAAGYPIVLHIHDEIVAEVPNDVHSVDEFQRIITMLPTWAEGLPVAAKVRNGLRFAKTEVAPRTEPEASTDEAGEAQPITQADIDEINAGLKREGIEPLQFSAEAPPTRVMIRRRATTGATRGSMGTIRTASAAEAAALRRTFTGTTSKIRIPRSRNGSHLRQSARSTRNPFGSAAAGCRRSLKIG
jgi:hypothetical protein